MSESHQNPRIWLVNHKLPARLQADLLGRLAITLQAGIDLRKAWGNEVKRMPARWGAQLSLGTEKINNGEMLSDALSHTGLFPPLVIGMVAVGDQTGKDVETLKQLSRVINHAVNTTNHLRSGLIWPAVQLVLALLVVGVLILVSGTIELERGKPLDFIGLGLVGASGLRMYGLLLVAMFVILLSGSRLLIAGWRSHGVIRGMITRLPLIGAAARAGEAASWSRAASLAAGAGLDAGRLVSLSGSVAPGLAIDPLWINERLLAGDTLTEALQATHHFPSALLEGLAVGEESGEVSEVLGRLSDQFADNSRKGFEAAAKAAGGGVWLFVACLVVLVIFRVFSVYVGMIQDAVDKI